MIVRFGYVNLGIAMDTEQGLIVPVVKEVQSKGILQIAAELADLAERTRAGKVKPDELKGSTFSITNAGNIGGTLATPIINHPDVAILGVHRLMKKPGVVETPQGDKIEVRRGFGLDVLPQLVKELGPRSVDVLFIDAIKTEYPAYFEIARPMIREGGLLIADNVLGAGSWWIDDEKSAHRAGADALNRTVASDPDFEAVAVPLREGVLIARRYRVSS